jgi:hypothetical protein
VLLNGITDFVTRPDLANRSIIVELAPISERERKTETQVMSEFEADLPLMLGVLMDGMASALKNREGIQLENMPRMADVALWCTAAEEGLKWPLHTFLKAFENNQLNAVLVNLSTDPVATALRSFLVSVESGRWTGSATELLIELNKNRILCENSKKWPDSESYLSQYISRIAPSLRKVGINFVGRDRSSHQRQLIFEKQHNFREMNPKNGETERLNVLMFDS